jgi:hypothetical protein
MNTFAVNSYAFVVLEGYIMAIIKTLDFIYLFDSHARNSFGMPDPNGTAVVMKYTDINALERYLCSLSAELNVEIFEIGPVGFEPHGHLYNNCEITNKGQSAENTHEIQEQPEMTRLNRKRAIALETDCETQKRLLEANLYKKRNRS